VSEENVSKVLGRIEANQEVQNERLRELSADQKAVHRDSVTLMTQMQEIQRRLAKLEPEIETNTLTNTKQTASSDQERRDASERNAAIALILSMAAIVVTILSNWFMGE